MNYHRVVWLSCNPLSLTPCPAAYYIAPKLLPPSSPPFPGHFQTAVMPALSSMSLVSSYHGDSMTVARPVPTDRFEAVDRLPGGSAARPFGIHKRLIPLSHHAGSWSTGSSSSAVQTRRTMLHRQCKPQTGPWFHAAPVVSGPAHDGWI